jgi:[glutamine synthetase] adenylyltransferase / [glutamine synthetase]-adenylyl-L-tyrosine phosphorylase
MPGPLMNFVKPLPPPSDRKAAMSAFDDCAMASPELAQRIKADPAAANLLAALFGGSPYLRDLVLRNPEWTLRCLDGDPSDLLASLCAEIRNEAPALRSEDEIMRTLRRGKLRGNILIALADLSRAWAILDATKGLADLADALINAAVDHLLVDAAAAGHLPAVDPPNAGANSGYVVLAMGKLGAHELNFSSDVDLMVFYDPSAARLKPETEPAKFFVRLTRRLVRLLQDTTEDGYVYRVDLRLRPDPRATQIAIAMEAAAIYYESMGQNWERAAMIKARPVAGDLALGHEFLKRLTPYVWRKYLDFAAIADVQSLKRQIHAVKGHGNIAVRGHDVKLGRGGIREIEFFVQTQQLIAGGRNPSLRGRRTLEMLDALADAGWIAPESAGDLKEDYCFLRHVEHRIQMIADEQTHLIPADDQAFARLAAFAGADEPQHFEQALHAAFSRVQDHYAALFEDASALGGEAGSLVFTGGEDDPETIRTLRAMGFMQAGEVAATIRGWHFGRYAATRSARAKEILTEIMPALLKALSATGDADRAFMAFDRFLSGLSAGVQIFSMLRANPSLLDLLARVLGMAPRLADELSKRPKVLDAVLDRRYFGSLPDRRELEALTADLAAVTASFEDILDQARIIGKEQMFRIGVRILTETVSAEEAGLAFSNLADVMVERLLALTRRDMAARHGTVAGEQIAVIAMGKLGGREMTAGSDLDLILIYDVEEGAELSSGPRPISVMQYFARTTQRLIAALSSPTPEGILYETDLRLRPSGNKGPVASHIASFIAYHRDSAWTWEKLAMTRARVIAGDTEFCARVERSITEILLNPLAPVQLRADVAAMRRRMLDEIGSEGVWDLKHQRGGLIDIEFITQHLQLLYAARHPDILASNTMAALARLIEHGLIGAADAQLLMPACRLYHRLTQLLRLCLSGTFRPETSLPGLATLVASAIGTPDLRTAEAMLADMQAGIAQAFDRLVGVP